jgi:hypothetical protein
MVKWVCPSPARSRVLEACGFLALSSGTIGSSNRTLVAWNSSAGWPKTAAARSRQYRRLVP